MNSPDDFESRLTARLRRFSDETVTELDVDRTAVDATSTHPKRQGAAALTVVMAVIIVGGGIATANTLSSVEIGQSPLASIGPAASITVVPSGASGQPVPSAAPMTPAPSLLSGLTELEAIAAARAAAPHAADRRVVSAKAGPVGQLMRPIEEYEFSSPLEPDRWVWVIAIVSGDGWDGEATLVVIDYLDGRVYLVFNGMS